MALVPQRRLRQHLPSSRGRTTARTRALAERQSATVHARLRVTGHGRRGPTQGARARPGRLAGEIVDQAQRWGQARRIALKDTIAVAGLLTDGTDFIDHVPNFDATIVDRILAAGGEIAGKAVC